MTRQEVEQAFLEARDKSVQSLKVDDVREMTRFSYPQGKSPFDKVNLRIAKGELSTDDPLRDFLVMRYRIDNLDDIYPYYKKIEERITASSGELIAVAKRSVDDSMSMKNPVNPRKEKSWIGFGIIQDGIDINLQSGSLRYQDGDEIVAYFPSIDVRTNGLFYVFFPEAVFVQKKHLRHYPENKSLHLGKPNFVYTGWQRPVHESPVPQLGGTTIVIGNEAVEMLFEKARAGKELQEARKLLC